MNHEGHDARLDLPGAGDTSVEIPKAIDILDAFFCLAYCLSLTAMICVPLVLLAKWPAWPVAFVGGIAVCLVFPRLLMGRQRVK